MSYQDFWKKYEFAVGQSYLFRAGYVEIEIKHVANGWLLKTTMKEEANAGMEVIETDSFEDDPQTQLFQTGKNKNLFLVPTLPNKAVVFRNNKSIKISPRETAELYFKIPLSIRFYSSLIKDENLLCEVPLQRLSDTWFGEVDNGEPAYSIGGGYDIEFHNIQVGPFEAVSPVSIVNHTNTFLDLQRLILRVEYFSLYENNGKILSSLANIEYKGPESESDVRPGTRKNIHGEKPQMIAKPRSIDSRNLLRKSFYFIKNIYQN